MAKYKTLSLEDRVMIAARLKDNRSYTEIGREIGRSSSTVLREIQNYSIDKPTDKNDCQFATAHTCDVHNLCNKACGKRKLCRLCNSIDCKRYCSDYSEAICERLCEPPYVCNGCSSNSTNCRYKRRVYDPSEADKKARETRRTKASGYDYTDEELDFINRLVSPLILNGQSPYAILVSVGPELDKRGIHISKSTLYRMINRQDLDGRNIDLPEKVKRRRPKTKKRNHETAKVMIEKAGRMYGDYEKYIAEHQVTVPQMDCVEGKKTDKCALLTIFWSDTNLQIAFLMERHDPENVVYALDKLEIMIGLDMFRRMLPAILTDNGQEFTDIKGMERSCTMDGELRTKIFFCDPNRSDQKGACERNHREMRRIIPKGKTSLDEFMQADICLMMDHVNSYPRETRYGKSPYEIAFALYPQEFIDDMNFTLIPGNKLEMKPSLLKKKSK